MKLFDINGTLVSVDVRESSFPIKPRSRSILQGQLGEQLIAKYPQQTILEDFIIPGSKLSLDFFIPRLKKAYEVNGDQHYQSIPFFHGAINENKFAKQVNRDIKKAEWCEMNGIDLIEIRESIDYGRL